MIQFHECKASGYPGRTKENILNSDGTIAIALDFYSAGELLTRGLAQTNGKPYLALFYDTLLLPKSLDRAWKFMVEHKIQVLNGAGNGIYSLKGEDQLDVDMKLYQFLAFLQNNSGPVVEGGPTLLGVRSGGQTGVDEAYLRAADALGIPTECLAPRGWILRGADGQDIRSEKLFKSRFICT